MNAQLRSIPLKNPTTTDKLFFDGAASLAVTDKEGTVRLYSLSPEHEEPVLQLEYTEHKGLVMDLSFSPITHPYYLLSCGYDRVVNLRSREAIVFSYKEADSEVGFFTSGCFSKTKSDRLSFLVGSSNGYVLEFSSDNKFKPVKRKVLGESVTAIDSNSAESFVVCGANENPKICFKDESSEEIELKSDLTQNKLKMLRLGRLEEGRFELALVDELNNVELMGVCLKDREVRSEAVLELPGKVLNCNWNFSGLSVDAVVQPVSGELFGLVKIAKDVEGNSEWALKEVKTVTSE